MGPEVGLLLGHKGLHKCTKVYESFHRFGSWELGGTTVGSSYNLMNKSSTNKSNQFNTTD